MTTETLEAIESEESILAPVKALMLPDTAASSRSANNAVRMAQSFVIASQEDFGMAADELAAVKGKWNKMEAQRTAITGPMNKALTAINALFKGPMEMLKSAENTLKSSMLTYSNELERIAAEARRLAEQQAAAERRRIEEEAREVERTAAAERQRIANEEAARVEAANKELEELEAKAVSAQQSGDTAAAAAIEAQVGTLLETSDMAAQHAREESSQIDQAATSQAANLKMESAVMSVPVLRVAAPAVRGISKSVTWDFELVDIKKVIAHISEHPELASLLMLDSVKTRAYVKSLGANCKVPGLNVYQKSSLSARAA